MNDLIKIGEREISIKEYNGQRVVTFKDIDTVHGRPEGTASRNFRANRNRFVLGEDYYVISADEIRRSKLFDIPDKATSDFALITEQGYLMLVKSFTDDLAWDVQRKLVNGYFRVIRETEDLSPNMIALYKMLDQMAATERKANEAKQIAEHASQSVENIKDAVRPVFDNWRSEMAKKFNRIQYACGEDFKNLRVAMYEELDNRAHVNLNQRLKNLKSRKLLEGSTKSSVEKLNNMDVIEADPRLREIFAKIVTEYEIKYCA